ncbi:MAG: PQQ-dependent sugar dehydrogenase [Candidatus Binatia bacterium]
MIKRGKRTSRYRFLALVGVVASAAIRVPDRAYGQVFPIGLPPVELALVAGGFQQPLFVTHAGDGSGRLFVLEQPGRIQVISGGQVDLYLDITAKVGCCGERGLLGLAFDSSFETNGRLYASYTNKAGHSVIERYVLADPANGVPDPLGGEIILTVNQPFANHNGGMIAFGPDGYLYFGLGDGGSANDPGNRAQNLETLLGKMLRIDVSTPTGYAVPADNPFVAGPGLDEIWALGLRNPWRFSFDRANGDLWIADVGQFLIEEVNHVPAGTGSGANFGWRPWEGHNPAQPLEVLAMDLASLTFPVMEYPHNVECSVTGGYVYRGSAIPELSGQYLFGDFCSGIIRATRIVGPLYLPLPIALAGLFEVSSFGEDEAGEVYVTFLETGQVRKLAPAGAP